MSTSKSGAGDWIARLALEKHPEGGWFRRIYAASPSGPCGRPAVTSIYYLLDRDRPRGRLHVNRSDILHFLLDGGPVEYFTWNQAGPLQRTRLGMAPDLNRVLLVPGGCWKATELAESASHVLVAEVVTPGFEWQDHAYVDKAEIRRRCPQHLAQLERFLASAG